MQIPENERSIVDESLLVTAAEEAIGEGCATVVTSGVGALPTCDVGRLVVGGGGGSGGRGGGFVVRAVTGVVATTTAVVGAFVIGGVGDFVGAGVGGVNGMVGAGIIGIC